MMQRGLLDPEKEDPFSLFVAATDIRYCYYADTHKILGNTFGMCVLQVRRSPTSVLCTPFPHAPFRPLNSKDFEALTPNLLARTIETVEGGGVVVMLLSTLTSLSQLYSLTMDCHSRLRTESHQEVTGRSLRQPSPLSLAAFWQLHRPVLFARLSLEQSTPSHWEWPPLPPHTFLARNFLHAASPAPRPLSLHLSPPLFINAGLSHSSHSSHTLRASSSHQ